MKIVGKYFLRMETEHLIWQNLTFEITLKWIIIDKKKDDKLFLQMSLREDKPKCGNKDQCYDQQIQKY